MFRTQSRLNSKRNIGNNINSIINKKNNISNFKSPNFITTIKEQFSFTFQRNVSTLVYTYNLLSPNYASINYFIHCKQEDLNGGTRFLRIIKKIQDCIDKEAILCLQEVPQKWAGNLHSYFQQRNYHCVTSLYGSPQSGFMGILIAFPNGKYRLNNSIISTLSTTKSWRGPLVNNSSNTNNTNNNNNNNNTANNNNNLNSVQKIMANGYYDLNNINNNNNNNDNNNGNGDNNGNNGNGDCKKENNCNEVNGKEENNQSNNENDKNSENNNGELEYYDLARKRLNTIVLVNLQENESKESFCVATTHLPCAYQTPKVMTIFTGLVGQFMVKNCSGKPFILAGDFNFTPPSLQYQLLTTGVIDVNSSEYPNHPKDNWSPNLGSEFKSAYMEKNQKEPLFTNYCKVPDNFFKDTIDYIFLSPTGIVDEVLDLSETEKFALTVNSFPARDEPSDHIMIGARITFPTK